jgi:UDP-2,4-diacetamido-2,4,6-trideoxy-beta-L-altropyranose hydrolase
MTSLGGYLRNINYKIAFRVDASHKIGTGHVMRCLALAGELMDRGAEVMFICRELPGNMCVYLVEKGLQVFRLPANPMECCDDDTTPHALWVGVSSSRDREGTFSILLQYRPDWLVVDHYALDAAWESAMRLHVGKIMVIDDLADRPHDCDLLLDQNLYKGLERRYEGLVPDHCERLLGPRYALLRPEFAAARKTLRRRDGHVRRIFIFFGGSDLSNETAKALEAIRLMNRSEIAVDVVVGASNPKGDRIREICQGMPNTRFHLQVGNMAELMALADLAIGAGGTTTWERCCLGLPTLALVLADNQREVAEAMSAAGAMRNVGWHADVTSTGLAEALRMALASPDRLNAMSERSLAIMGGPDAPSGVECISDRLTSAYADS